LSRANKNYGLKSVIFTEAQAFYGFLTDSDGFEGSTALYVGYELTDSLD
jgi:hypothetical protein